MGCYKLHTEDYFLPLRVVRGGTYKKIRVNARDIGAAEKMEIAKKNYLLKDHLGSTRALLTEEIKIDRYPTATLEGTIGSATSPVEKEKAYFDINTSYVQDQPLSMPTSQNYLNDNGTNNPSTFGTVGATSQKMYKTNATTNKTGLGMVLKVMAGDKINILAKSYYFTNTAANNSPFDATTLINAFLGTGLAVGAAGNAAVSHGATVGGLTSNTTGTFVPVGTFTNNNLTNPYNNVKAGLAYILFDEQFNYAGGGFDPVLNDPAKPAGGLKPHFLQDIPVPKNGYIYIYCSNESNKDVFFDNLEVVHQRSPILEETHYTAWGSKLLGISAQAANGIRNNYKYNEKELQSKEFSDGSGLEWLDYGARMYDNQIGRWNQIDSMSDSRQEAMSPYAYVYNNPILYSDHEGKFGFAGALIGGLIGAAASLTKSVIQNGFESLGDGKTWAKAGVNAVAGAIVGATGGIALLSAAGATAAGMAATAVTTFGTSVIEDKIDGNKVDYEKAAVSSFIATATFGFGKFGADKLTRNVRTNWWNRGNTNAIVRYLGKSPSTNVGQIVDRSLDVVGFAMGKGIDYFFPSTSTMSSLSVNNNSNNVKNTVIVIVEPLQTITSNDLNEKYQK
jgi:RHS repeat-associated protein